MIDLYYWPTPNGHKITIFLEETGIDYKVIPVNIGTGAQFDDDFLKIAPNNRIPAIIDHAPIDGGEPISIFESGAILQYLGNKTDQYIGNGLREKTEITQWLMWQMGGLGPMLGQNHHFNAYANEKIPYAIDRYINETARLYAVLNKRLVDRDFIAGSYSIADMACYPWIVSHERQGQDLNDFPYLKEWFLHIEERPAVIKAYELKNKVNSQSTMTEEAKGILFGQTAQVIKP